MTCKNIKLYVLWRLSSICVSCKRFSQSQTTLQIIVFQLTKNCRFVLESFLNGARKGYFSVFRAYGVENFRRKVTYICCPNPVWSNKLFHVIGVHFKFLTQIEFDRHKI